MAWTDRILRKLDGDEQPNRVPRYSEFQICLDWQGELSIGSNKDSLKFSRLVCNGSHSEITGHNKEDIVKLRAWLSKQNDLIVGYFSYDTKNVLEDVTSRNTDVIRFPMFHFFVPDEVFLLTEDGWMNYSHSNSKCETERQNKPACLGNEMRPISKEMYCHQIENLQQHIQFGDIYEVNYCVQHGFENTVVEPYRLYQELQENSPAPFSCYVADNGNYLISSSPERFMKKDGNRIVSQPMKGTNRRTSDNEKQKEELRNNAKEMAENVMITDLVRNDLSRSAKKGTVKVDELCGVYSFEHVNTMISTVSAELREDVHPLDALLNAFPMGSMTGAPKIRAMELIDQFEDFSRGLYSGAVGYFTPDLDFDFNVVIRSILYNEEKKVVTFPTGGAITIQSDPEKEYEECMLKAEAMRNVLLNHAK
ncbi:MAG: aminodeoxychorismate synthase component I [Flavobacteriales bacterium]|nr:aminodeoxychorismate synthase component I [Flavobacteriales bacterium]